MAFRDNNKKKQPARKSVIIAINQGILKEITLILIKNYNNRLAFTFIFNSKKMKIDWIYLKTIYAIIHIIDGLAIELIKQ